MAQSRENTRFKNTIGRLMFELLYGELCVSSKGLTRTFKIPAMAKQCNIRADQLIKNLRILHDGDLLETLHIDYKDVTLKLAPPHGIKKKEKNESRSI